MKKLLFVALMIATAGMVYFGALLAVGHSQETAPRTLQQIQTEFTQWQTAFNKANANYNTGMRVVERAQANMQQAEVKLQALIEEAKQIQAQAKPKPAPIGPVDPDCPDGNCEEAPVK